MDYEHEINSLFVEAIAIQTVLAHVLDRISRIDDQCFDAVKRGFDDAANDAEDTAIKLGKTASPDHLVKAIRIIEELRTATLGNPDKPTHAV